MTSTVAASAGNQIPITRTWVQTAAGSPVTTEYTLVGQILYNGQTNWVGYNNGKADYLYTTSTDGAKETTLADGSTYWFSEGSAPGGYLLTSGGVSGDSSGSMTAAESSSEITSAPQPMTTTSSPDESDSSSSEAPTDSASPTPTMPSAGHRLSVGAVFSVAVGLLAVFSL